MVMVVKRHVLALVLLLNAACAPVDETAKPEVAAGLPVRWSPGAIATAGYESSPTFTPDGLEMYYVSADRQFRNYRLLQSRCENGTWSPPQPASFAMPLPVIEADPFVTPDGRRLYYISSRQAPDREDFDIWFVERQESGEWGQPQRMPEPVNSKSAELLPRMDGNGRLYFGSDRPGGFGQSDIYQATQDPRGNWTVVNVGPPVSTSADDYEAEVSADGRSLILVSDRGDKSHLYHFARRAGRWVELGRIPAAKEVFQVGPTLSPAGDRLLFAQADAERSGEIYLVDLEPGAERSWPPCNNVSAGSSPTQGRR